MAASICFIRMWQTTTTDDGNDDDEDESRFVLRRRRRRRRQETTTTTSACGDNVAICVRFPTVRQPDFICMEVADDDDRRQETTTTTSAHVTAKVILLCSTNDDEDDRRRRRRRRAEVRQSRFDILWRWRTTTRTKAILWRVNINLENTSTHVMVDSNYIKIMF